MQRRSRLIPLLLALSVTTLACAELTERVADLPKLRKKHLRFSLAQSSKIYDTHGNVITTMHETENRTVIPLSQIPSHVKKAVVAIEDERFYEHGGVDLRAILRALVTNATSGEIREGGSTITQQLVKNVIIAPGGFAEKTLDRKIVEAALSRQLEQKLSKKEILESYLNTVYFGEGAYGVQEAAKTFFGVPAKKLTVAQGAMLAGLIRAPEDYNPYKDRIAARTRRDIVINKMVDVGWLSEKRAQRALKEKLGIQDVSEKDEYPAPYFVDYVQRLITDDPRFTFLGKTREERVRALFRGGLRIHTTVDLDMQAAAERAVEEVLPNESDPHASLVAIEPETGHVKALVGGRDWFADPKDDPYAKLNLAILAEPGLGCIRNGTKRCVEKRAPGTGRQAGSAFKVFALAAAIDQGVPLSKTYKAGSQIEFPGLGEGGSPYIVRNYESSDFGGSLSLLEATVFSVNVVYAQLVIDDIGPESVVEMAEEMGIRTPLLAVPSAVLGANEINPLGMASAYGTLATNGQHIPPVAIERIVGPDGEVLYEDESVLEEVIEPQVAYLTTTALEQVIQRGTAARYGQIGRPAAGKTGTAQEYRDAWFVGYTPDLVASVWVGYPQGQIEMKSSCAGSVNPCIPTRTLSSGGVTGGSFPTLIWSKFMLAALAGTPATAFEQPTGGFVTVTIDTRQNNCLASELTPDEYKAEATFVKGTEPEKVCGALKGEKVELPNVVGYPFEEAVELLERNGFEIERRDEPTSTYPPGIVVGQEPGGGERVPSGATVTLAVSVAKTEGNTGGDDDDEEEMRTVPSVLGMTDQSAQARLEREGFEVRFVYEAESNKAQARRRRGRVWKQSPSSGSEAPAGSTVTVWVNP